MADPLSGGMDAIARFITWFRAPYKTMFAAWILAALWLKNAVHTLVAVIFWFITVFLILAAIEYIGRRVILWWHFQRLPQDERRIIHAFVKWDARTKGFISGAATAAAMAKMGILEVCEVSNKNNVKTQRGDSFFTIKPWVFRYFKKRRKLFELSLEPTFPD